MGLIVLVFPPVDGDKDHVTAFRVKLETAILWVKCRVGDVKNLLHVIPKKRKITLPFFSCIFRSLGSAKVNQGHDCGVLVLQTAHVSVTQRVIVFDDAVAAELTVAK